MKLGFVIDNPDLMKEWDWAKNDALGLYPEKITLGSNKKAFWKCSKCGHSWDATINNRARGKGQGCPVCANKILIKGKNDLKTLYPEIAKKTFRVWFSDLNGNPIRPDVFVLKLLLIYQG